MNSSVTFQPITSTAGAGASAAGVDSTKPFASVAGDSPWLRSAAYDLCFFAFPWLPFLLLVVFGLEWHDGFGMAENPDNFKLIVPFLLALTCTHRNYTYLVAYGDTSVFGTRKTLFTIFPAIVFPAIFVVHSLRDSTIDALLVTVIALWNIWHTIMQRHGLLRGYARRIKDGFERRRHGSLDLALLWGMVLFTVALGAWLHLPMLESYEVARPTVDAIAPFFSRYPIAIAVTCGLLLLALGGWWGRAEWQHAVPFKQRLPRLVFLLSNASLLALCLVNPVLGVIAFGFSHAVEYLAYVHTVQKRKVETKQYRGMLARFFWSNMLLGAGVLIGFQILAYYHLDAILENDLVLDTLVMGTAALHFFYDGLIWKKSKKINTWAL